ncbi:MAG: hypothetical protein CMG62_09740 [Candidatus Marinimicrobia bacterium]|nr:hypothetical protein [Candidatus Neomarinimicrobiota bacterium]
MNKLLKIFIPVIIASTFLQSQSLQGNIDVNAITVHYTYVARAADSPEDDINGGGNTVSVSWPSSAEPLYTRVVAGYAPGDTITTRFVPLVTPELMAAVGVALNIDLNDDGTFTINEGSTYPTTEADNCSTYATVPGVSENGNWTGSTGFVHPDDPTKYSLGWGISLSSVFAQFSAADILNGQLGVDYGPETNMPDWGMATVTYTDDSRTVPAGLEIYWEATDGPGSGLGVDDNDQYNAFLGVPVSPGDTVTISNTEAYLMYVHPDTNLWYNLGWTGSDEPFSTPILNGSGHPIDPNNPDTYEIDPFTGDTSSAGRVTTNRAYIFDPSGVLSGGDGVLFSGDELLAPTGYFFTFNYLEAGTVFSTVLNATLPATGDLQGSLTAAADSVAYIYLDAATSSAIGASVGQSLYDQYVACLGTGAGEDQCSNIFLLGPTATLLAVQTTCAYECGVDDSGWDFDPQEGTGRLIFEVDNACILDKTTQRVNVFGAYNATTEVESEAPIAEKFELHGNFPNPFNPVTKIRFSTERESLVKVTIFSILGEEISVVENSQLNAGTYNITWYGKDSNGDKVPSGLYFYEVKSDNRIQKGKMLLLK